MLRGATFDSTGVYRYHLWREWDRSLRAVTFVMLNPSTADAEHDDPTIRRCIGFARSWGYGRLEVVNLFAFRASSPRVLASVAAPAGDDNEYWLRRGFGSPDVVLAWGNGITGLHHSPAEGRTSGGVPPWCLGITRLHQPRHPLYVHARTALVPFTSPSR